MRLIAGIELCAALALACMVAGCNSLPTAGMLYAQHTVGGLEVAVGDPTVASSPAHIKIGYSNDFGTYIPMAVGKKEAPLDVYSLLATGSVSRNMTAAEIIALATVLRGADVNLERLLDIVSVYSSFETSFSAKTQSPSAEVSAGNVFATGFAARAIAGARLAAVCIRIQELIDAATAASDTEKKKQFEALRKSQCT